MPYNPVITKETAREIVLCRLDETESVSGARPLKQFAQAMYECGLTPKLVSNSYMAKLLRGEMFPDLTDRDGQRFDWSRVPRAPRGRRAAPGREKGNRFVRMEKRLNHLCAVVQTLAQQNGVDFNHNLVMGRDDDNSL